MITNTGVSNPEALGFEGDKSFKAKSICGLLRHHSENQNKSGTSASHHEMVVLP